MTGPREILRRIVVSLYPIPLLGRLVNVCLKLTKLPELAEDVSKVKHRVSLLSSMLGMDISESHGSDPSEPEAPRSLSAFVNLRRVNVSLADIELRLSGGTALGESVPAGDPAGESQYEPSQEVLTSRLCTMRQFSDRNFVRWIRAIGEKPLWHRKQWEYFFILQALFEKGMIQAGKRGLGFGVGREPLVSLLASHGCEIVATDLDEADPTASPWKSTGQHVNGDFKCLNERGLCPSDDFDQRVSFRFVDMKAIPGDLRGFDFIWSCCSAEHLGSLQKSVDFLVNSLECLKPNGIAVHTTEYNVSSDEATWDSGPTVLFRRRDLVALRDTLQQRGWELARLDLDPGEGLLDSFVDVHPFGLEPHLKLQLGSFTVTSVGLIITRCGA